MLLNLVGEITANYNNITYQSFYLTVAVFYLKIFLKVSKYYHLLLLINLQLINVQTIQLKIVMLIHAK